MPEINVNGWLPIRIPLRMPDWPSPTDFSECLEQFCHGLVSVLPMLFPPIISVESRIMKPPSYVIKDLYILNGGGWFEPKYYKFLNVKCVMEYDNDQMNFPEENNVEGLLRGFAACDLASTLEDALLLAQLSFPTRIHSASGRTYLGRHPMNEISKVSGISHESIWEPAMKWPEVRTISLEKVCTWEVKLGLFQQGIARTPVQRALASFTHLVTTKSRHGGSLFFGLCKDWNHSTAEVMVIFNANCPRKVVCFWGNGSG